MLRYIYKQACRLSCRTKNRSFSLTRRFYNFIRMLKRDEDEDEDTRTSKAIGQLTVFRESVVSNTTISKYRDKFGLKSFNTGVVQGSKKKTPVRNRPRGLSFYFWPLTSKCDEHFVVSMIGPYSNILVTVLLLVNFSNSKHCRRVREHCYNDW